MRPEAAKRPSDDLVNALLAAAGIAGSWTIESVAPVGWINSNTIVRVGSDRRVVVRTYQWPFDTPPTYDRRAKEAWLHPHLAEVGVPVAKVLAFADVDGKQGALLEWLPGETLGVVAQRVGPGDLHDAWHAAGAALRRAHSVPVAIEVAGLLDESGSAIAWPGASFGSFHQDRIHGYANDPAIDALIARAKPALEATPLTLCHSDAHAWNVLVAQDSSGDWKLSGWLDWEFAWVGDPAWDHMRMTVQRFADIGPTPEAWFEGYGTHPPALNLAVATLHFMLWKAVDEFDNREREVARAWLRDLPNHLRNLESLID